MVSLNGIFNDPDPPPRNLRRGISERSSG